MLVTGESRGFTELGQSPLCIQSLQKTVYDVKVTKNITFLLGKLLHHTHTHTHLTALFPGLPKVKPVWILLDVQCCELSDR